MESRQLQEDVDAFFVRGYDVELFVLVHVSYLELGPYAGVVVDFVRDELGAFTGGAAQLEPIEYGGLLSAGVFALVGEISFAGYDVLPVV